MQIQRGPKVAAEPQCASPTDVERPVVRPLEAYAFDPSAGKLLGNEMTMNVRYQDLDPGPVVRDLLPDAIAIVDYDGANKTYYKPIDLADLCRSPSTPSGCRTGNRSTTSKPRRCRRS